MTRPDKHNIVRRLINRAGRPFGILPFAVSWDRPDAAEAERRQVFESIFHGNHWGSAESVSGPGSELERTAKYRRALTDFLCRRRIRSMFDAPCGDLNWMGEVLGDVSINYVGGDISDSVVAVAKQRNPELDLRRFDICADDFPDAEVWQCRDALIHLSFADIWAALANAARSNIEYALLSSHRARLLRNLDIATGGVRPLDLQRPPFRFPSPVEYLDDSSWLEFPRAVGVWRMESIREIVARGPAT